MVTIVPGKRHVYWEYKDGESNKFWAASIIVSGKDFILIRRWGKIGTEGQQMEQRFGIRYEADVALDKLIKQKEREGYKPVF